MDAFEGGLLYLHAIFQSFMTLGVLVYLVPDLLASVRFTRLVMG